MGLASVFLRRRKLFTIFTTIFGLWLLYIYFVSSDNTADANLVSVTYFGRMFTNWDKYFGNAADDIKPTLARQPVHPFVNIFNASMESPELQLLAAKYDCVRFKAPGNTSKICVYPEKEDIYVSGNLIRGEIWESQLVHLTRTYLMRHPGMAMLDLGCNIGTFTIDVAKMDRKVVAVDANKMNLMLLSRSLDINNLQHSVTLVWNAVSDVRENVILSGKEEPDNIGGWHVESVKNVTDRNITKAVFLDDLAYLFGKESVFIKMDIEGSEMKALAGGKQFLESVNVTHVLLEFFQHRNSTSGKQIVDFLSERGYRAFSPRADIQVLLDATNYARWPDNVLWIKQ